MTAIAMPDYRLRNAAALFWWCHHRVLSLLSSGGTNQCDWRGVEEKDEQRASGSLKLIRFVVRGISRGARRDKEWYEADGERRDGGGDIGGVAIENHRPYGLANVCMPALPSLAWTAGRG